jgi:hypothetical protein
MVVSMSNVSKTAWAIQIVIFVLLLVFLPHGTSRIIIVLVYIVASVAIVNYIRRKY